MTLRVNNQTVSSSNRKIIGHGNRVSGMNNVVEGDGNSVSGMNAIIIGNSNNVSGMNARVTGNNNTVSGIDACVIGDSNKVSGMGAKVKGRDNTVTGMDSVSNGHLVDHGNGEYSRMFQGNVDFGVINIQNMVGSSTPVRSRSRSPVRPAVINATKFPAETATDVALSPGDKECYVCFVNKSVVISYPCAHAAGCVGCCRLLIDHGAKSSSGKHTCPECRAEVIEFLKTYI